MNPRAPRTQFRFALTTLALAWVCVVGYNLFALAGESIVRERRRFEDDIATLATSLKHKLDTNEAVLAGFVAFLQAVDRSDLEATDRFAASTTAAYPHIYMMEVARQLPRTQETAFQATMERSRRGQFAMKDFSALTGKTPPAHERPADTWPIVFAFPAAPHTEAIIGLRLESVDHLSRTLALAHERRAPVASPVFGLYEGDSAYILLQEAARTHQQGAGDEVDVFGDTMAAMLVIKGSALAPGEVRQPRYRHTRAWADLESAAGAGHPIFDHQPIEPRSLAQGLLPTFTQRVPVESRSQRLALHVERQLTWRELVEPGAVAKVLMLLFGLVAVPWLAWRHLRLVDRLADEYENSTYGATHDALTDLPNRVLFTDRVKQALLNQRRNGGAFALFLVDLDHFKQVNDTYGHHAGDAVLAATARRLTSALRSGDTVSRYGGDEFAGLLGSVTSAEDARAVGEKLLRAVARPIDTPMGPIDISCSIGMAICPDHGDSLETLSQLADEAMYEAKAAGRNTVSVHGA